MVFGVSSSSFTLSSQLVAKITKNPIINNWIAGKLIFILLLFLICEYYYLLIVIHFSKVR